MPESASVSNTPASGWRGVEGRLVTISRPEPSDCSFCTTPIRSVNVPPVSIPTRRTISAYPWLDQACHHPWSELWLRKWSLAFRLPSHHCCSADQITMSFAAGSKRKEVPSGSESAVTACATSRPGGDSGDSSPGCPASFRPTGA